MCVYNNLLDSNAFLNYPHLRKDVFKAMNESRIKIILQRNYNKNPDDLIHRIIFCFRVIIHRLYIKFSSSYRTHFFRVKNDILKIKEEEIKFISAVNKQFLKINLKSTTLQHAEELKKNLGINLNVKNEKITNLKSEIAHHSKTLLQLDFEISTLSVKIFEAKKESELIKNQPFISLINFFKPQETADKLDESERKVDELENILEMKITMNQDLSKSIQELNEPLKKTEKRKIKTEKLIEEQTIENNKLETSLKHSKHKLKKLILSNTNLITEEPSKFDPPMKEFLREILSTRNAEVTDDESSSDQNSVEITQADMPTLHKTAKTTTIETFERFNLGLAKVLKSFLSRFECKEILSFTEQNGNFNITLQKPLKLWIPKIKNSDPHGGSILLFGMENLVSGKLTKKGIEFTKGFEVYCKQSWYGFVTASILAMNETNNDSFDLTAGKYGINQSKCCGLSETIHHWGSSHISEVVEGDHEAFLNTKL